MFDIQRMQQVLIKLISNAIVFSDFNSHIYILAKILNNKTNLAISVVDHGIGIDETEQIDIFKPFFKSIEPQNRKMNP